MSKAVARRNYVLREIAEHGDEDSFHPERRPDSGLHKASAGLSSAAKPKES
jgi:hypothetical protein